MADLSDLYICLKHLSELSQDNVEDDNKLTHGRQIRRAKNKAYTSLDDTKLCSGRA